MTASPSANEYVVTHTTKQGRTMKATLYGTITPERIAAANAELAHRAEQLFWVETPAAVKEYRGRQASSSDRYPTSEWEYDEFDDDEDSE